MLNIYPCAECDIYPEGAQAFRMEIELYLARWKKSHPGEDYVFFHIGEPGELPPTSVLDEAVKIYRERKKTTLSYQPVDGLLQVREAVAGHLQRSGVSSDKVSADDIVINVSGKGMMNAAARALRRPKLVVAVFSPCYPGNGAAANKAHLLNGQQNYRHGVVGIPIREENNWQPDHKELAAILKKEKPGLLIICNPQNPTGGVLDLQAVKPLIDYLIKNPDVMILEDGMYHKFDYSGGKYIPLSLIAQIKNQVFFIDGASKDLRFTGARIGWIRCPRSQKEVRSAIVRQLNDFISCAPTPECLSLIPALSKDGDQEINKFVKMYREKRDLVVAAFAKIGLKANLPQGAFYLMLKVKKTTGMKASQFAKFAAEKAGVTVLPAKFFGSGLTDIYGKQLYPLNKAEEYVRISYVGKIKDMLLGIERLGKVL